MKRERTRSGLAVLGVGLVYLFAAQAAGAAVTVGQVSIEPEPNNCPPGIGYITTAVSSGPSFVVPAGGGVITSWQTRAGPLSGITAKLKVFRATLDPDGYLVVGQSVLRNITPGASGGPGALNGPFPTRIPVQGGDFISSVGGENGGPCSTATGDNGDGARAPSVGEPDGAPGSTTLYGPNIAQTRSNVAALLEADADGDDFGDETQDNCPGVSGSNAGCAPAPGPNPQQPADKHKKKNKKCKQKGKHRTAATPSGGLAKKCKKK
jgi:hypothetical protein